MYKDNRADKNYSYRKALQLSTLTLKETAEIGQLASRMHNGTSAKRQRRGFYI